MFQPKTPKIAGIANANSKIIKELEKLLAGNVHMSIDYANVRPWSTKLKWHIDLKRLKQFLDSFDSVKEIKFYHGTLEGNESSGQEINTVNACNYIVRTKPVKIMKFSIDVRGISSIEDKSLLEQFIRKSLLRKYSAEAIEYLNQRFEDMNKLGEFYIEDRKCNFGASGQNWVVK